MIVLTRKELNESTNRHIQGLQQVGFIHKVPKKSKGWQLIKRDCVGMILRSLGGNVIPRIDDSQDKNKETLWERQVKQLVFNSLGVNLGKSFLENYSQVPIYIGPDVLQSHFNNDLEWYVPGAHDHEIAVDVYVGKEATEEEKLYMATTLKVIRLKDGTGSSERIIFPGQVRTITVYDNSKENFVLARVECTNSVLADFFLKDDAIQTVENLFSLVNAAREQEDAAQKQAQSNYLEWLNNIIESPSQEGNRLGIILPQKRLIISNNEVINELANAGFGFSRRPESEGAIAQLYSYVTAVNHTCFFDSTWAGLCHTEDKLKECIEDFIEDFIEHAFDNGCDIPAKESVAISFVEACSQEVMLIAFKALHKCMQLMLPEHSGYHPSENLSHKKINFFFHQTKLYCKTNLEKIILNNKKVLPGKVSSLCEYDPVKKNFVLVNLRCSNKFLEEMLLNDSISQFNSLRAKLGRKESIELETQGEPKISAQMEISSHSTSHEQPYKALKVNKVSLEVLVTSSQNTLKEIETNPKNKLSLSLINIVLEKVVKTYLKVSQNPVRKLPVIDTFTSAQKLKLVIEVNNIIAGFCKRLKRGNTIEINEFKNLIVSAAIINARLEKAKSPSLFKWTSTKASQVSISDQFRVELAKDLECKSMPPLEQHGGKRLGKALKKAWSQLLIEESKYPNQSEKLEESKSSLFFS